MLTDERRISIPNPTNRYDAASIGAEDDFSTSAHAVISLDRFSERVAAPINSEALETLAGPLFTKAQSEIPLIRDSPTNTTIKTVAIGHGLNSSFFFIIFSFYLCSCKTKFYFLSFNIETRSRGMILYTVAARSLVLFMLVERDSFGLIDLS